MPARISNRIIFTLFTTFILAAVFAQGSPFHFPVQREIHARVVRKRTPVPQDPPIVVIGAAPPPPTDSTVSVTTPPTASDTISSTVGTDTSSSSSSTDTTSSSTDSQTTSETTQQTSESTSVPATPAPANTEPDVITLTSSVEAPSDTADPAPSQNLKKGTTALTIIIIVSASVGGIIILWTIFRKWVLARSDKFDKRLNPTDWQPPEGATTDAGIVPANRRNSAMSYNGSSVHGHGIANGSNHGHGGGLGPLPDHDFTAGVAHVGDYANLARGPSYNPHMQQTYHHQGPSFGSHEAPPRY